MFCQACFQNSDHEGHDYYMHRTSAGGCCDCGDIEAWDSKGFCKNHRGEEVSHTSTSISTSTSHHNVHGEDDDDSLR